MSMCVTRKKSLLLLASCFLFASLLVSSVVSADSNLTPSIPVPEVKPVLAQAVAATVEEVKESAPSTKISEHSAPLPSLKPSLEALSAEPEVIQVATVTKAELYKPPSKGLFASLFSKNDFSDKQAELYQEVFDLQRRGHLLDADEKMAGLSDPTLLGHVLAERYLNTGYEATYDQLKDWLDTYNDHPQATDIFRLASKRKLIGGKLTLMKPKSRKSISGNFAIVAGDGKLYKSSKSRSNGQNGRVKTLVKEVESQIAKRAPTNALHLLNNDYAVQFMDDVEYDVLRAQIAAAYLYAGKMDQAYRLSEASLKRSGTYVPLAGWVKGLVHWQRGEYENSARGFEAAATSPYASGWMISAAGYWASRAHMRSGNVELVSHWLDLAATYPRTFYGLIATRALGHDINFNWDVPQLTREHVKYIEGTKRGKRAAALIKVGQLHLAEAELQNIDPKNSIKKQQALLAYASYYQLPALSLRLGSAFLHPQGGLYDAALYPVTGWQPQGGYRIDQALIYAIVRQESRFRSAASNPSGATGLMQLMPRTANYIAGQDLYNNVSGQYKLQTPEINLEIGQRYIEELLDHKTVKRDLLSLAIAYNAGPGNLAKWKRERANIQDPLLFIETIPFNETRAFVERVLSNYWIYRMRMNQQTPSLDAVAEGKWARYASQDGGEAKLAKMF